MPTLQDALSKALSSQQFDDDAPGAPVDTTPTQPKPESSLDRTWQFFKDHPNATCKECAEYLGVDLGRAASDALSLTTAGDLKRDRLSGSYRYSIAVLARPTLQERRAKKSKAASKALKKTHALRIAEHEAEDARAMESHEAKAKGEKPPSTDVDDIINGLSVLQARALYDKLRTLFGG